MTNGTESPGGRLGAVLRLVGQTQPVALGPHGPWVVTTAEHARAVLTDPGRFDFPSDVSRRALSPAARASPGARSPHHITPPLDAEAVRRGADVFAVELDEAFSSVSAHHVDAMSLLRVPVALSTVSAVLPGLDEDQRGRVALACLDWIDALGPVIARARPPGRWSAVRRREERARLALEARLREAGEAEPSAVATMLAAGIQVPIAAGAWLLVKLAEHPAAADDVCRRPELARAVVWETVRLCPPTWITARIAREGATVGDVEVPAGGVVMVSPLLLGRSDELVPGGDLADFEPARWDQERVRPGAWLPFGAGPHACPGRNLGLAQLTQLATWAADWRVTLLVPARVDQSRGIFPHPAWLSFHRR